MTVDGTERSSVTAAPTSLTFAHTTRDAVKTVGLSVPTATLSQKAWPQCGSGHDYSEGPVYLAFRAALSAFRSLRIPRSSAPHECLISPPSPRRASTPCDASKAAYNPSAVPRYAGPGKLRRRMSPAHQFRLTLRIRHILVRKVQGNTDSVKLWRR